MIIDRLGEGTPLLDEMLKVLGATVEDGKLVIPTIAIRQTPHGIEVNVQEHYSLLRGNAWGPPAIGDEQPDGL